MLTRSAKRRLRQAINRANKAVGRIDSNDGAEDSQKEGAYNKLGSVFAAARPGKNPEYRAQETAGGEKPSEPQDTNQFDRRVAVATVAIAILTGGLFLVGIASAVIANCTLDVINGQLAEMKSGSAQTDKLISSNADLATAAKTQAIAQEKYAATAQDSFIASERARIISNGAVFYGFQTGQKIKGKINYANVGREAALVDMRVNLVKWSKYDWIGGKYIEPFSIFSNQCLATRNISGSVLIPPVYGVGVNAYSDEISSDDPNVTNGNVFVADDGIAKSDEIISVNVCFTYKTVTAIHHTSVCYYYWAKTTPSLTELNICDAGEGAD